jgi:hypothetical protein
MIHPNRNSFDLLSGNITNSEQFQVIKLNGNAFLDVGLKTGVRISMFDLALKEKNEDKLISIFLEQIKSEFGDELKLNNSAAFKYFNFAWEFNGGFSPSYDGRNNIIETAKSVIETADVLIVVGYSFPTFNTEIDKLVLSKANLKEIIIQDINPALIQERLTPFLTQLSMSNHKDNPKPIMKHSMVSLYFPIYNN